MRYLVLALGMCAAVATADADEISPVEQIRAGREALVAEQPDKARSDFETALASSRLSRDDRFSALIGLGRAEVWLGDYGPAARAFREALHLAQAPADKRAASIGLAKALNGNEYYAEALSLSRTYSSEFLDAAVETLRAEKALGLEDLSPPVTGRYNAEPGTGQTAEQFASLKSDMDFALADRLSGGFSYSHDSDHLTVTDTGVDAWFPGPPGGDIFESVRVASDVLTVDDPISADTLSSFTVGSGFRVGNTQHADIALSGANVRGWDFFEGNADWDYRPSDIYDINASLDRSPILTTTAIADHLLFETYSVGGGIRVSDNVYVDPALYHQDFSDGNTREGASLRVVLSPYDIPLPASAVGAQIFARIFHSTEPSTGEYFNPKDYNQAQFDFIAVHRFNNEWSLRALAGGGYQSVDGSIAPSYDVRLSLIGRLPGNGRVEFHLDRNSFASNSGGGSGYSINTASVSITYPIGI